MKGGRTGLLGAKITRIMAEKKLRQADILKKIENSKGKITNTMLRQIIDGTTIPRNPEYLDAVATALGEDRYTFRSLSVIDSLNKILNSYNVKIETVCEGVSTKKKHTIPLYESSELHKVLSDKGYPLAKSHKSIEAPYDFGPDAYGIIMKDNIMYPKATQEEICVIAVGKRIKNNDFAIVGTKKKIMLGKVIKYQRGLIIETLNPFQTDNFLTKDVKFAYPIKAVLSLD